MLVKNPILTSERLVLASFKDEDFSDAMLLFKDPLVKKTYMLPDLDDREKEEAFFKRIQKVTSSEEHYSYGVFLDGKAIGLINDVTIEGEEIEVGYCFASPYWGKGYATEAFKTLIEELFRVGFKIIQAAHFNENPASGRVMVKCGLSKISKTEEIEYRGMVHSCTYYEIRK